MPVYQRIDSFRRVILDREASATGCDEKIDMIVSVTQQAHCLLDREYVIGHNSALIDSPLTVALVGENTGEYVPGFVRYWILERSV